MPSRKILSRKDTNLTFLDNVKERPYSAPFTDYGFQKTRDQQSVFVIDPVQTLIRITETKS